MILLLFTVVADRISLHDKKYFCNAQVMQLTLHKYAYLIFRFICRVYINKCFTYVKNLHNEKVKGRKDHLF